MADQGYDRKLIAILGADVKGYSRLMGNDEEATLQTLNSYRQVFTNLIEQYRGRVVSTPGDYILAAFNSVVNAVKCAIDVQEELSKRNAELPDNRKMEFRIGINLGDVIEEEDGQIYGDGVNIAARMEPLAEPGGVCISGRVYDQVANKLGLQYEYLGEYEVKNIVTQIRVYRIISASEDGIDKVISAEKRPSKKWRNPALAAGIVAFILIAFFVGKFNYEPQKGSVASEENMAFPLPDEPSIAIMPFTAIGGAEDERLLSHGILTSITTALSKTPKLFTVDYASTSKYKGKDVSIKDAAEELSVRYVLLGDLQKSGEKVRINVKLIDALSGKNMWAEKYDRSINDLFAMQDDITKEVLNALQVELYEGEFGNVLARGTDNLEAYLKIVQGYQHWQAGNKENDAIAQRLAKEAIAIDPEYSQAYSLLSRTLWRQVVFKTTNDPDKTNQGALDAALIALELDYSFDTISQLGWVYARMNEFEKGVETAERGLTLNPNNSRALTNLGLTLSKAGRCEEAINLFDKALRVSPIPSVTVLYCAAAAYRDCKRYDECLVLAQKAAEMGPDSFLAHLKIADCYALSGRLEEAKAAVIKALKIFPKFTVMDQSGNFAENEKAQEIAKRLVKGRLMAGFPPDKSLKIAGESD